MESCFVRAPSAPLTCSCVCDHFPLAEVYVGVSVCISRALSLSLFLSLSLCLSLLSLSLSWTCLCAENYSPLVAKCVSVCV